MLAGPVGRAIRHDRLGPHLRDGLRHAGHAAHHVCGGAQQPHRRGRECGGHALRGRCEFRATASGVGDTFSLAGLAAAFTAADELPAQRCSAFAGLILLWRAPRANAARLRAGRRHRGCRVLRHQLDRPRQPAPPYAYRSDDRPERQLVQLHVHRQWPRSEELLARPAGHRSRRADQADLCIPCARRPSRHFLAHAGLALQPGRRADVARLARSLAARTGGFDAERDASSAWCSSSACARRRTATTAA